MTLLSVSRSIKPIGLSFGSFSHWYAAAIIAGIAFVAVLIGRRRTGPGARHPHRARRRPGLRHPGRADQADAGDPAGELVHRPVQHLAAYALVGAGIVGIWLMQNAFSAAPLHASLPAIAAGEPLAGIALGIVVFGDRIQITPGMLAIQAGGIAALIVGVVAVARSSAFCGLRKITHDPAGRRARKPAARGPLTSDAGATKPSQATSCPSGPTAAWPAGRPPGASAHHGARGQQVHGPASGGEGG